MATPSLGLWGIGRVQCTGVVSPYGVLDIIVLGLSSTSMSIMEHTSIQAICVPIRAETTWITRGGSLHASCTGTGFQVLKLLDFTLQTWN